MQGIERAESNPGLPQRVGGACEKEAEGGYVTGGGVRR